MNPHFKDLLSAFIDHGVEFIVVGAHALAAHGHVRATKDMDLWIRASSENADRAYAALSAFGAPMQDLSPDDLNTPGTVFQIGVEPIRIDIINQIDGVTFDEAWPERVHANFAGLDVPVLSRAHLIQNKTASGRAQDLADVEVLEKLADSDD